MSVSSGGGGGGGYNYSYYQQLHAPAPTGPQFIVTGQNIQAKPLYQHPMQNLVL